MSEFSILDRLDGDAVESSLRGFWASGAEHREAVVLGFLGAVLQGAAQAKLDGDLPRAITGYDRVLTVLARLPEIARLESAAHVIATIFMNRANLANEAGDNITAGSLHDRAIEILEPRVASGAPDEIEDTLAAAYSNRANVFEALGDADAAGRLRERTIAVRRRLVFERGRWDLADRLGRALVNRGLVLVRAGDVHAGIGRYDLAIRIREHEVYCLEQRERLVDLGIALASRALARAEVGDTIGAQDDAVAASAFFAEVARHDRGENIAGILSWARKALAGLVPADGGTDGTFEEGDQALTDAKRARAEGDLGHAIRCFKRAIAVFEAICRNDNDWPARMNLSSAWVGCASAKRSAGHSDEALRMLDCGIAILKEVQAAPTSHVEVALAKALFNKGNALNELERSAEADACYERVISLLEDHMNDDELGVDVADTLASCLLNRGGIRAGSGDIRHAAQDFERAIAVWARLAAAGKLDATDKLYMARRNRAACEPHLPRSGNTPT